MSLYPCRQALRPVVNEPHIIPTQGIAHVAVVPIYPGITSGPLFHDGLDWHFYIDAGPGDPWDICTQLRDTFIQADANFHANGPRADGSGAVSFESEGSGDNLWTGWQVEAIIWLFNHMYEIDGIPLRICPAHDQPGLGYHRLFNEWNSPYHSCPGDPKVDQFYNIIMPALSGPLPAHISTIEDTMKIIVDNGTSKAQYLLHAGKLMYAGVDLPPSLPTITIPPAEFARYVRAFGEPVR